MPARLTRPYVGLSPVSPQHDEGIRIEPPVSLPLAIGTRPAATAAPEPPLELPRDKEVDSRADTPNLATPAEELDPASG